MARKSRSKTTAAKPATSSVVKKHASNTSSKKKGKFSAKKKPKTKQPKALPSLDMEELVVPFAPVSYQPAIIDLPLMSEATIAAMEETLLGVSRKSSDKNKFPIMLHKLLETADDLGFSDAVCWHESGRAFIVKDKAKLLPVMNNFGFKHKHWDSFQRQLNHYGFVRKTIGKEKCIAHIHCLRGHPLLVLGIKSNRVGKRKSTVAAVVATKTASRKTMDEGVTSLEEVVAEAVSSKNILDEATSSFQNDPTMDISTLPYLPPGLHSSVSSVFDYCNRFVPVVLEEMPQIEPFARPFLSLNSSISGLMNTWNNQAIPAAVTVSPEKPSSNSLDHSSGSDKEGFDLQAIADAATLLMQHHETFAVNAAGDFEKMAVDNILALKAYQPGRDKPMGLVPPSPKTFNDTTDALVSPSEDAVNNLAATLWAESAKVAVASAAKGKDFANGLVAQLPPFVAQDMIPASAMMRHPGNLLAFPSLLQTASCGSTGVVHVDMDAFFGPEGTSTSASSSNGTGDDEDDVLSFNSEIEISKDTTDAISAASSFWEKPTTLVASTSLGSINIVCEHSNLKAHPGSYNV